MAITLVRIFGAITIASLAVAAQAPRTIYFSPGVALESRILDDDRDVVIEKVGSPPPIRTGRLPSLEQEAKEVFELANAIAVVTVKNSSGVLVNSRDWIRTDVAVTIKEFIKLPNPPLANSDEISFVLDGGEARVRNARVRAGVYPILPPGASYLMPLWFNPEQRTWQPFQPFLINADGVLSRHDVFAPANVPLRSPFYGQPATKIIALLKSLVLR